MVLMDGGQGAALAPNTGSSSTPAQGQTDEHQNTAFSPQHISLNGRDLYVCSDGLQTIRHDPAQAQGLILHLNAHNEVRGAASSVVPAIYRDLNEEGWDIQALSFKVPLAELVTSEQLSSPLMSAFQNRQRSEGVIESRDLLGRLLARILWGFRAKGYQRIVLSGQRVPAYHLLQTVLHYPKLPFDGLMINDPTLHWDARADQSEGRWLVKALERYPANRSLVLSFSEGSPFFPDSAVYDALEKKIADLGIRAYLIRGDEQRVKQRFTAWSFSPQVFSHYYRDCIRALLKPGEAGDQDGGATFDCRPKEEDKASANWMQVRSDLVKSGAEMLTPKSFRELLVGRQLEITTAFGIHAKGFYSSTGRHSFQTLEAEARGQQSYQLRWSFEGYNICTHRGTRKSCRRIYRYAQHFIFLNPNTGTITSWSKYQSLSQLEP